MILVDTSVWVDFLRGASAALLLRDLLADDRVLVHPWVVGELALGSLGPRREQILGDLRRLPTARPVADGEILALVAARGLAGSGIGWVDAQLLGACLVAGCRLWTHDRRLRDAASRCGVALAPPA